MKIKTRELTLCAVLAALALALSYMESFFPLALIVPLPGVKLGLANIVTLYALYALGASSALAILVVRCLLVARDAAAPMESYVCVGMAGMLIFQTIANIGMCLFLMPVIGLTLPFFSYGGSSIVTLFAAMGIVSGVKKRSRPEWLTN